MARTERVLPENLDRAIMAALEEYSAEVTRDVKAEVKSAAETCRQLISSNAAGSFGGSSYAKSWRTKKAFEDAFDVRYTVYSRKYYQLTHLLEYGHDKWVYGHETGGFVRGRAHIRPAEEQAERQLVSRIERKI